MQSGPLLATYFLRNAMNNERLLIIVVVTSVFAVVGLSIIAVKMLIRMFA